MKRLEAVTIEEAYKEFNNEAIEIQYVFGCRCKWCKETFKTEDEEYSLDGTKEEFIDNYTNHYPDVLELTDIVTCIDPIRAKFRYYTEDHNKGVCPLCAGIGLEYIAPDD